MIAYRISPTKTIKVFENAATQINVFIVQGDVHDEQVLSVKRFHSLGKAMMWAKKEALEYPFFRFNNPSLILENA